MTNTPERYDHHEDGMEIAKDGDFVSYHDYEALLARAEQAEADADSWMNRAIHQNEVANAAIERAEQAEAALKATLEREAETHRRLSEIYVKHTGNDLVNVEVALDDALDELSACKELGGCGYWRDRSKVREADLIAALARIAELEAKREEDHKNINIKADFIEKMIGQSSDDHYQIKELGEAVRLLSSMVISGEGHTKKSRAIVEAALTKEEPKP
jgi:hypothetical protein